ncbi:MAG: FAD-dependent monooxygenase [Gemmatimonadaceae bacterium]|nr:FAD-dependent monooxygenase [Gemmatimonadaceae bacterium]
MRQNPSAPILIVGAGPTGLNLALWLTRLNVRVRLVDSVAQAGTTSRALAVQARTLELYQQLGFADAVVNDGVKILGLNVWAGGKKAARMPLGEIGKGISPFSFALVYPQDAHEKLLIEKLADLGVHVEREVELVSLAQQTEGVDVALRTRSGEEQFHASYVAGCDGASSTVRHQLGIGFPGGTYEGLFYVADVVAEGPVADNELHVDLEDSDFLLVFPLKGNGRLRLVGFVREQANASTGTLTFDDVRGKATEHVHLANVQVNWFSTYRVHHRVADRFRKDRVFLLGDAAHVHSPVGGQGMNTGIGDAVNLAWKLAAVLKGEASPRLLDSYEPERIAFAQRLVATTDRGFAIATARGPIARFIRTQLIPLIAPFLTRVPTVRRLLFRTVSQTNIEYRRSSLSEGKAGKIRAGERLPWARDGDVDNFDSLELLGWQVHVYGTARPELMAACKQLGIALTQFSPGPATHRAGLADDALYLIRPDGYVGLADPEANPNRLINYFRRL